MRAASGDGPRQHSKNDVPPVLARRKCGFEHPSALLVLLRFVFVLAWDKVSAAMGDRKKEPAEMKYVLIGAGPAGVRAAETLREEDPDGSITLVSGERGEPYARMAIPYILTGRITEEGAAPPPVFRSKMAAPMAVGAPTPVADAHLPHRGTGQRAGGARPDPGPAAGQGAGRRAPAAVSGRAAPAAAARENLHTGNEIGDIRFLLQASSFPMI